MTGGSHAGEVDDSIFADETGLFYAVQGPFRLRSTCQPIYARQGDVLVPVAVEGSVAVLRDGVPVEVTGHKSFDAIGRVLSLCNHRHLGADGLSLFVQAPADARFMREIDAAGVDPAQLICDITALSAWPAADIVSFVHDLRGRAAQIAVTVSADGSAGLVDIAAPDVVRVDPAWFAMLCRWSATARLFGSAVSSFAGRGMRVLAAGIDDAARLSIALHADVSLYQGAHLAGVSRVGTAFDGEPVVTASRLRDQPNVVPMFAAIDRSA